MRACAGEGCTELPPPSTDCEWLCVGEDVSECVTDSCRSLSGPGACRWLAVTCWAGSLGSGAWLSWSELCRALLGVAGGVGA